MRGYHSVTTFVAVVIAVSVVLSCALRYDAPFLVYLSTSTLVSTDGTEQSPSLSAPPAVTETPAHHPLTKIVTLVSDARRPHQVLGSVALRTPQYLYLEGNFIPKACNKYSPECLREDHTLILEHACAAKEPGDMDGIIIKEDDFEACVPPEQFVTLLGRLGLLNRTTVLGYGTGLFYVPYARCALVASLWRSCSGPVDDCLNKLADTPARTAHVDPPLAVHRHDRSSTNLHQHKCDPLCFVSCWDAGNYKTDYFDASEWIQTNLNATTRRPRNFSCNHSGVEFDAAICFSTEPIRANGRTARLTK